MTRITGNTFPVKEQLKALGGKWNAAAKCWEVPEEKAAEAQALVAPHPLYNSPPPADLGTADPAELAARFGRTPVAGAVVKSYTGHGKVPDPDGTIRSGKGIRVVQVAHDRPRYYSRDMLEDFDMFDCEPGYQYRWDGVEVEPTDAERASDEARARTKAEEARKREEEAARAQAKLDEQRRVWEGAIAGLEHSTASPRGATETSERLTIAEGSTAVQVVLPDGRTGWRHDLTSYDDYRTYWYLPADVANAARLAHAEEVGITPEKAADWLNRYKGCHGEDVYRAIVEADDVTWERLRRAAAAKAERESAERRGRDRGNAARQASKAAIARACGVETAAVAVDFEYPPKTATVQFAARDAAAKAPRVVAVASDADAFDPYEVAITAEGPPEDVLVRVSLGKSGREYRSQTVRLNLERAEFTAAWPVNEHPAGHAAQPSRLPADQARAYRAARKKAGTGALASFGTDGG